jgi:hypothetical protein
MMEIWFQHSVGISRPMNPRHSAQHKPGFVVEINPLKRRAHVSLREAANDVALGRGGEIPEPNLAVAPTSN